VSILRPVQLFNFVLHILVRDSLCKVP